MGVYPLLTDETCWLVAADFDKRSWADDVLAFTETCRMIGVPSAVERSRSGQGAHAWFFFAAPVLATAARKMASYLLTETMSRHHQLGMESYDRLFPNQDTLPRAGFGNLIALPLQHEPRQAGNTVFVDDGLVPYPDQWAFLATVPRIDPDTVDRLARDATHAGQSFLAGRRQMRLDEPRSLVYPARALCYEVGRRHPDRFSPIRPFPPASGPGAVAHPSRAAVHPLRRRGRR